ncbi:choline transporter-like protein 4 isoform X2 [Perognathus longimembris pacificus]|uniref:choline transporter-like protein 4 isoform X2 n=1 Tax=Perognathus longimembris pacificus TaxID=214514 RepID=UPI00201909E1|nr:choline transporter-like protein 4 isoform X2 [Perognathus longimembris pacificus]
MGGKQDENEAYGKPAKYDPSFRGPIKNRSCTDVICCLLFFLFILGYIVVGIVAWVYGDPRQVLYPRNSTGAYCGMGENKDKPYVLYFNIFSCILTTNIIMAAQNSLQCPTPQVCVSACPEAPWAVEETQLSMTVEEVFSKGNRNVCLPGVPQDMTVRESLQQELCPRFLLPSTPALGRCFPLPNVNYTLPDFPGINNTSVSQGISGLLDSINARDITVKIFEDFARSWYWILVALGVALILSLLFILLLRLVAGPLVLVLILGVLAVLAYGIYHCWEQYRVLRDKGASIYQLGFTTNLSAYQSVQETWLAALIVLAVIEGILLLLLIFLRQRIRIAIALLQEASKAVGQMMSTLFYPLVTFVLLVICIAYWAMTALYLATSGQPQYVYWVSNESAPGCENVPVNASCDPMEQSTNYSCPGMMCVFQGYTSTGLVQRSLFNLQIYGVLGLFWTLNWVLAFGQCVLAGAFASFYWAFHKPRDIPSFPLSAAFIRTLRYHTGSLAFGALILSLVQIARIILEYIDHRLRGAQNPVARCIMCCFKCCLWCLEKFIKFLNRNAYIMIAIYGKNFCVSAKNAFMLLMRNVVRVVVLDKVTDLLLFFGKLLVVGGVGKDQDFG